MIRIITSLLIASQMLLVVACGPKGGQAPNLTPPQAEVTYKVYREEGGKRTELTFEDEMFQCNKDDKIVIVVHSEGPYKAHKTCELRQRQSSNTPNIPINIDSSRSSKGELSFQVPEKEKLFQFVLVSSPTPPKNKMISKQNVEQHTRHALLKFSVTQD